jgi:hypothetical protein
VTSFYGTSSNYLHPGLIALGDVGGPAGMFMLPPDSPAIDAGDDDEAAARRLVFDQFGEGHPRILGEHVDIGAIESHVIDDDGFVKVFGTNLDDVITIASDSVTFDRFGEIPVAVASATALHVDTLDGDDEVIVDAGVSTPVYQNHPPRLQSIPDQVVTAGSLVAFQISTPMIQTSRAQR